MTDYSPYLQAIHELTSSIRRLRDNPHSIHAPDYTITDVLSCIDTLIVCAQREHDLLTTKVDELERAVAMPRYTYTWPTPDRTSVPVVMTPTQYREVWDLALTQYGKIPAIKQCREYSRVGLKEAKDYVECMMSMAAKEGYVVATTPEPTPEPDDDLPF